MPYNYYLDESGNSGDLISKKSSSTFGGQPIFALSCVGLNDPPQADNFVQTLKKTHEIKGAELKSEDIYFKKPEAILEIAEYLYEKRHPIFIEVVDKKYCVSTAIVGHQILPPYDMPPDNAGALQFIRNTMSDFLSFNMTSDCYGAFYKACLEPNEENLFASMEQMKSFFGSAGKDFEYSKLAINSIDKTIYTYLQFKSKIGERNSVKKFIPIPDEGNNGASLALLPHIHCKFNILARLNKYHLKGLNDVVLNHDSQEQFDQAIRACIKTLKDAKFPADMPMIDTVDFHLVEEPSLNFVNSEDYSGVQLADVLAGFVNRYVNGFAYKNIEVEDVYHRIFKYIVSYNRPMSPLGVNFVLPPSKQKLIFDKFHL